MATKKAPSASARDEGRQVAETRLIEGRLLIGQTVTISCVLRNASTGRANYRGLVYNIGRTAEGCEVAFIACLGMSEIIAVPLEPLPPDPAGAG